MFGYEKIQNFNLLIFIPKDFDVKMGIHYSRQKNTPQDVHILVPGTYKRANIHEKRDFEDVINHLEKEKVFRLCRLSPI